MIIAQRFSFNGGETYIESNYSNLLTEIEEIIESIDAERCRLKKPKGTEIIRAKRAGVTHFYSPRHLNAAFDLLFSQKGWDVKPRIKTHDETRQGFREMDFLKDKLGVEVQIGKYAFLTYDIVAKMPIFRNLGVIDAGVEICPMASMLPHMSSGIGAFEQVRWDLKQRGAYKQYDVPVLLLGFESKSLGSRRQKKVGEQKSFYHAEQAPEIDRNRYKNKSFSKGTQKLLEEIGLMDEGDGFGNRV